MAIDNSKPWEDVELAEPTGPDQVRPDHNEDPDDGEPDFEEFGETVVDGDSGEDDDIEDGD